MVLIDIITIAQTWSGVGSAEMERKRCLQEASSWTIERLRLPLVFEQFPPTWYVFSPLTWYF